MLLWLSTSIIAAPALRFIKSQQPFGHQPQTPAPQLGLRGGIYLAAAAQGERPSITKSPSRVDVPKDILARASFARVTCRNKLYLYFIHLSPWISIPKRLCVTGHIFAARGWRPGSFAKIVEPKHIDWPLGCWQRHRSKTWSGPKLSEPKTFTLIILIP